MASAPPRLGADYPELVDVLRRVRAEYHLGRELLDAVRDAAAGRDPCEWAVDFAFDVAEAMHYVGTCWHGGQGDPLYYLLRTGFGPGVCWSRPERGSGAASLAARMIRIVSRGLRHTEAPRR